MDDSNFIISWKAETITMDNAHRSPYSGLQLGSSFVATMAPFDTEQDMQCTTLCGLAPAFSTERDFENVSIPTSPRTRPFIFSSSSSSDGKPCSRRKRTRVVSAEGDAANTSSKKRRESKKSVGFVTGNVVIPRHQVTEDDLPNTWYKRDDYKAFQEDSHSLVIAFELGILDCVNPDELCLRGLEASLSSNMLKARVAARDKLTNVVLQTQEAQRDHGIKDPEMIRGLSIMLSRDAAEDALKLAAYDFEEAQDVMKEGTTTA